MPQKKSGILKSALFLGLLWPKKTKTKKGVEYLVNYIGYPESMIQWVKASDLKRYEISKMKIRCTTTRLAALD